MTQEKPSCGCASPRDSTTDMTRCDTMGKIPRVNAQVNLADHLGVWKARWGIGRMSYIVRPGLYAVGNPTSQSPVFVSANYKMSFDRLRSNLDGRDGWTLVLDTMGINVWCAAGKGTFGTEEIVNRLESVGLKDIVSHRKLVLPQLGAPGVSAHEVKRRTGFSVVYGPVRAEDLPTFLDAGMRATPEMRLVTFPLRDRLVLIPVELTNWAKYVIAIVLAVYLVSGLGPGLFSLERAFHAGTPTVALLLGAFLTGIIAVPVLLPYLPGRAFSVKGASAGLLFAAAVFLYGRIHPGLLEKPFSIAGWFLLAPAIASFVGMNFTGASTYTSLSGVLREMRIAVPAQIALAATGMALWLIGRFIQA